MKTDTSQKIILFIKEKGTVRPIALRNALKISAQALHRHLRRLVSDGILRSHKAPPFTEYLLADFPDFEPAFSWLQASTVTGSPHPQVSETRETFTGRLSQLASLGKQGVPEPLLPLLISIVGEVGNNSFDHNLGQWRDVPGCWFELQMTGKLLWVCLADRGQGIFSSLSKVHPDIKDEAEALKAAFEQIISGRAPERRGNGLKYVRVNLSQLPGAGIACISGNARVSYGELGQKALEILNRRLERVNGTVTLMVWRLV